MFTVGSSTSATCVLPVYTHTHCVCIYIYYTPYKLQNIEIWNLVGVSHRKARVDPVLSPQSISSHKCRRPGFCGRRLTRNVFRSWSNLIPPFLLNTPILCSQMCEFITAIHHGFWGVFSIRGKGLSFRNHQNCDFTIKNDDYLILSKQQELAKTGNATINKCDLTKSDRPKCGQSAIGVASTTKQKKH